MRPKLLTTNDLTSAIIILIRCCGCDPTSTSKFQILIWGYYAVTTIVWTILTTITLLKVRDGLEEAGKCYISVLIASQTCIKILSLKYNSKELMNLLDNLWNKFWPVDTIPELTDHYNKRYNSIRRTTIIYRTILNFCILFISVSTLKEKMLPYDFFLYNPETEEYFTLICILQIMTISTGYFFGLISFDMLFIISAGCVGEQFDMIQKKLMTIGSREDEQDDIELLRSCINHHNLILQYVKDMDNFFTVPLLKQYLDAISCMGIYLYLSQTNLKFVYVFSLITNFSQTLLFSSFGQMMQDKGIAISDAAYNNRWPELGSGAIRRGLLMVTQRAHRPTKISAGGFIHLSFESFVGMIKAAGSFLAVLRSTNKHE